MLCGDQSSSLHGPVSRSSVSILHCSLQPSFQLVQHARSLRKLQIDFGLGDETASFMHRLSYAELPFHLQEVTLGSMSQISGESLAQSLMRFLCRYCDSLRRIYLKAIFLEEGDCVAVLRCLRESEFSALEEINLFYLRDGDKGLHFPGVSENPIVDEKQGTNFTHFSVKKRGGGILVFVTRVRRWMLHSGDLWIGRNSIGSKLYLHSAPVAVVIMSFVFEPYVVRWRGLLLRYRLACIYI